MGNMTVQLSQEDVVMANKLHNSSSIWRACIIAPTFVVLLLLLMGVVMTVPPVVIGLVSGVGALLMLGLILVINFVFAPAAARRFYRQQKNLHEPYQFTWSAEGLRVTARTRSR